MVKQDCVKKVPYKVCRMETCTVCKKVPYTVCKSVPYTVNVKVPYTVTECVLGRPGGLRVRPLSAGRYRKPVSQARELQWCGKDLGLADHAPQFGSPSCADASGTRITRPSCSATGTASS
jgi:hypothetical protein